MNTDRFGTPQLTLQGESLFPRRERNGRTQRLASACESFGHFLHLPDKRLGRIHRAPIVQRIVGNSHHAGPITRRLEIERIGRSHMLGAAVKRQTVIRELFERIRESFPRPSHFGCGPLPVILFGQLPQGCLAVAVPVRLKQFQIGRRIAAQTPTEHNAVRRSGGQIAGMTGHQIQHGQSWNHGHFPRSIDLDLGDRLQSGLFRIAPMGHCPRPRPDSRQRILAHGRGDSATLDRQRPLADRHQPARFRKAADDLAGLLKDVVKRLHDFVLLSYHANRRLHTCCISSFAFIGAMSTATAARFGSAVSVARMGASGLLLPW